MRSIISPFLLCAILVAMPCMAQTPQEADEQLRKLHALLLEQRRENYKPKSPEDTRLNTLNQMLPLMRHATPEMIKIINEDFEQETMAKKTPKQQPILVEEIPSTTKPSPIVEIPAPSPGPKVLEEKHVPPQSEDKTKNIQPVPENLPPDPRWLTYVQRGDTLAKTGDYSGARRLYEFAVSRGVGQAATKMAKTYDPRFLSGKIVGMKPDIAKAKSWYERGIAMGDSEACDLLETLQ